MDGGFFFIFCKTQQIEPADKIINRWKLGIQYTGMSSCLPWLSAFQLAGKKQCRLINKWLQIAKLCCYPVEMYNNIQLTSQFPYFQRKFHLNTQKGSCCMMPYNTGLQNWTMNLVSSPGYIKSISFTNSKYINKSLYPMIIRKPTTGNWIQRAVS